LKYVSTRGHSAAQSFTDILLEGLAPDGGLMVPEQWPRIMRAKMDAMRDLPYPRLAFEILRFFADDYPGADLKAAVDRTYTAETFGTPEITPMRQLDSGLYILGLSNGPTLAFKDIALQLLGRLLEHVLEEQGRTINIVGATSGDTGSAAEHAMRGKPAVAVFMLSPNGRMSPFQQAQMFSLHEPNIHNLAIDGTFDDCQDIVKAVSGDAAFKARHRIGAVNSINWARVAAQVVYYFKGYFAATRTNDERVAFAVPSGNFGNILAAHVARAMGLPIERLVLATNENDVLDEFFRTGRYRPRAAAETHATSSPSMDISKASNFERFAYELVDRDPAALRALWQSLARDGGFDLAGTPAFARLQSSGFVSGRSSHADRLATIRDVSTRYGVVVDPHTADGIGVGRKLCPPGVPLIAIETALPVKFSATIREALGREPARPPAFVGLEDRPQRRTVLPNDVAQVKSFIAAHALA